MKTFLFAMAYCLAATTTMAQFVGGPGAGKQPAANNQQNAAGNPVAAGQVGAAQAAGQQPWQRPGVQGPAAPLPNPMFELIDANGDGAITKVELRKAIAQLRKLDADGDGIITLAEASPAAGPAALQGPQNAAVGVQGLPQGVQAAAGINREHQRMIGQMLKFDMDGDGMLSFEEVPRNSRNILQGGDLNRDGLIGAAELQAILEQQGAARARAMAAAAGQQNNAGVRGAAAGRRNTAQRNQDDDDAEADSRPERN